MDDALYIYGYRPVFPQDHKNSRQGSSMITATTQEYILSRVNIS